MEAKIPPWLGFNFGLKIWSVIIAVFLWFHVTTERVIEQPFRIPLETSGVPEDLVLVDPPPRFVEVTIRGRAKEIIRLKLSRGPMVRVDLAEARRGRVDFDISPEMVPLPAWTAAEVSQIVNPRELELDFDRKAEKLAKVVVHMEGAPRKGYLQVGDVVVEPPQVTLIGGRRKIRYIQSVKTEQVSLSGAMKTLVRKVRVAPEGFGLTCEPESVSVTIPVVEVVQKRLSGIPVGLRNLPKSGVQIQPAELTLVVSGPKDRLEELKVEEISAVIDLKGYPSGGDSLSPVVNLPRGLSIVSLEPEFFSVRW